MRTKGLGLIGVAVLGITAVAFAAVPDVPSNPNPAINSLGVSATPVLRWTAGARATSHDVYWGTVNPPPFAANVLAANYELPTLNYNTTYYWRIDEVNANGTTTGAVWSFTTE